MKLFKIKVLMLPRKKYQDVLCRRLCFCVYRCVGCSILVTVIVTEVYYSSQ